MCQEAAVKSSAIAIISLITKAAAAVAAYVKIWSFQNTKQHQESKKGFKNIRSIIIILFLKKKQTLLLIALHTTLSRSNCCENHHLHDAKYHAHLRLSTRQEEQIREDLESTRGVQIERLMWFRHLYEEMNSRLDTDPVKFVCVCVCFEV